MKTVALVGLAETTRGAVAQSKADEIWTLNWAYLYDFLPRIDRLFELHPIWVYQRSKKPEYIKPRRHWRWLHKPRDYPVYMLRSFPKIPNCIEYPLQEVTNFLFGNKLLKGGDPISFYSSSVDYMLALAMYEGFDRIELYGIEMGTATEYRYQQKGCALFIGMALARGIEVYMPGNSILMNNKKYGYEGGQMIFRQDLERLLSIGQRDKEVKQSRLNYLEGQFNSAEAEGRPVDGISKEMFAARDELLMAIAFQQTIDYLIRELDLEEPKLNIHNPLRVVPMQSE